MAASSVPPLVAPEGLTAPDRSNSLVIPPAPKDGKVIPTGKGACLDRPPSYFATKSPAPASAPTDAPTPARTSTDDAVASPTPNRAPN